MVTPNVQEIIVSNGVPTFGTAGSPAAIPYGYLKTGDPVTVTVATPDRTAFVAQGIADPLRHTQTKRLVTVDFVLHQFESVALRQALGLASSGAEMLLSGSDFSKLTPQFSFKLVAADAAGNNVTVDFLKATTTSDLTMAFDDAPPTGFPIQVTAEYDSTDATPRIFTGTDDINKTISTGAFDRTDIYHRLAGQSAAADDLDDITGSPSALVDAEIITLQIQDILQPITIVHFAGIIALDGSADFVMTKLNDSIVLQYNLSGTVWNEIGRHNAQS